MKKNIFTFITIMQIMCIACLCCTGGCAKQDVSFAEGSARDLRTPASFVLKIGGITTYTDPEDKSVVIPVGQLLREDIENSLNKYERFSVNKAEANKYILGVSIIDYNPAVKEKLESVEVDRYAAMACSVEVYTIENDKNGAETFGKRILSFGYTDDTGIKPHQYMMQYKLAKALDKNGDWRNIIRKCALNISRSLNDIFPK